MIFLIRFPSLKTNWTNAKAICEEQGGHLFNPDSKQQNDDVAAAAIDEFGDTDENDYSYYIFLGINDIKEEGVWMQSDGLNATFFNWFTDNYGDEPDNYEGNEDCAVQSLYYDDDGWLDISCHDTHHFVCEI